MKLRQVFPKPNNTSIIIYYSSNRKELRYPTGVSISNEKKNGKFVQWDYKMNMLKAYVENFESKKKKILELVKKANKILSKNYEAGTNITPSELRNQMEHDEKVQGETINSLLLDLYDEFLQMKREKFLATNTIISLKDFTSTKYLIEAFEAYKKKRFKLSILEDKQWFRDLLNFMRTPHPKMFGDYKLRTKGNMNEKTIKKRLDVIAQFADYLKDEKLLQQDIVDAIKKFRRTEITVTPSQKVTLTINEVHTLYQYSFNERDLENIKDVFVFLCFTGIRFQDLIDFNEKFIKSNKNEDGLVYSKKASKTGIEYNIPLCEIVIEILKKYQYKLPLKDNTQSNLHIKIALEKTGKFEALTELKHKKTGEYKKRYEAITMHKGRDTFITNLIDTTPLNELMKYTGHKKLSTLQGYVDNKRDVKMKFIEVFNKIK